MNTHTNLFRWCMDNFPERKDQLPAYRALALLCRKEWPGTQRVLDAIVASRNAFPNEEEKEDVAV